MRQARDSRSFQKNQKDSKVTEIYRFRDFLGPKYWRTWLLIGGIYVLAWLPIWLRLAIAKVLSSLAYSLISSRRKVAETNVRLCFPKLNEVDIDKFVRATFLSSILSFFETAHAWCRPTKNLDATFIGLEHLTEAVKSGKGVLLLGGHFALIDMLGALMSQHFDVATVYRKQDNPLINYFMVRARERFHKVTIARKDMKKLLRTLKEGGIVWYAPDQDYGRKASVFVPFYGVQTATITMTSKLAKLSDAIVIPLSGYRQKDNKSFIIEVEEPIELPSGDDVADAALVNRWLESRINKCPEQYLWLHKRFKTRPEGEPSVYTR